MSHNFFDVWLAMYLVDEKGMKRTEVDEKDDDNYGNDDMLMMMIIVMMIIAIIKMRLNETV